MMFASRDSSQLLTINKRLLTGDYRLTTRDSTLDCLSVTMMLQRKTMMGVSKDTRSSASSRKIFIRKVRKMDVAVN